MIIIRCPILHEDTGQANGQRLKFGDQIVAPLPVLIADTEEHIFSRSPTGLLRQYICTKDTNVLVFHLDNALYLFTLFVKTNRGTDTKRWLFLSVEIFPLEQDVCF